VAPRPRCLRFRRCGSDGLWHAITLPVGAPTRSTGAGLSGMGDRRGCRRTRRSSPPPGRLCCRAVGVKDRRRVVAGRATGSPCMRTSAARKTEVADANSSNVTVAGTTVTRRSALTPSDVLCMLLRSLRLRSKPPGCWLGTQTRPCSSSASLCRPGLSRALMVIGNPARGGVGGAWARWRVGACPRTPRLTSVLGAGWLPAGHMMWWGVPADGLRPLSLTRPFPVKGRQQGGGTRRRGQCHPQKASA
jgi:hypothetical protein